MTRTVNMLNDKTKKNDVLYRRLLREKILSTLMVIFGVLLITVAFFVPPLGVIDPSVLTAFGEILTFAGALTGIDAKYKSK